MPWQVTPEDVLRTYVASGRGLLHAAGDAAARHAALEAARPLAAADKRVLLLTTDALRDGHADARLAAVAVVAAALRGNATAVGLVSRLPFGDDDGDVAAAAFRVAAEHAAALTAQQKRDVATAGAQAAIAAADPATRVAALALLEAAPDAPRADVLRNALAAAMADAVATVRLAALAAAAVAPRKAVDFELVAGLAASDARPDVRDAAEYLLLLLDVASDGANDGAEDAAPSEPVRHVAGEHAATGDDAYDSASSPSECIGHAVKATETHRAATSF
ncbi:hypothetical protein M885DRAFT_585177 [Pelagophyceae sp. CCMP2097]|nr:hypothetical protein M885DRAFT_585177 [Pelagophyceae sp. CCMP2097]